jgi:hypothetical protein
MAQRLVHKRQRWWQCNDSRKLLNPYCLGACRLAADVAHFTVLTSIAYSRVEMYTVDSGLLNLARRHKRRISSSPGSGKSVG